jgi:hypothetical protein
LDGKARGFFLPCEFLLGTLIDVQLASIGRHTRRSPAPASFSDHFPPALHFAGLSIYPSVPLRTNVLAATCI